MQVAHIEDRALNAHLARNDRFAELDEMSFADLLTLEEDTDEWSLLDDIRAELRDRRDDAKAALVSLFINQCKTGGEIPMPVGGKPAQWLTTAYLIEAVGADEWSSMTADVLVGLIDRDRLIAAMAEEYANEQSEDLLRYGWSAQ